MARFFQMSRCYIRIKEEDYITYRVTIDAELYRRVAHAESDANQRTKTDSYDLLLCNGNKMNCLLIFSCDATS